MVDLSIVLCMLTRPGIVKELEMNLEIAGKQNWQNHFSTRSFEYNCYLDHHTGPRPPILSMTSKNSRAIVNHTQFLTMDG